MSETSLLRQLPNVLTIGNAVSGLAAVLWFFDAYHRFADVAGIRIAFAFIALGVVLDTLDGPLARVLKANSAMGAQLDSLCDGVTFGLATALIIGGSFWPLSHVVAFVLALWWLTAVLWRLARFKLETDTSTAHFHFRGLCSPVAALFMLAVLDATVRYKTFPWLALLAGLLLPVLMLSNIRFADLPKHYLARQRSPLDLVLAILSVFVLSPSQAVCLFLTWFVLQTVLLQLFGKTTAR